MKYRLLAGWVLGVGLVASAAAIDCGGDDTSSPAAAGSGGTAGSTGTAGESGTGGGMSGQGGTAGAGVTGGGGQGGGGATGTGGADASSDAPVSDGAKVTLVPFQSVVDILTAQCTGCHKGNDGSVTGLVDLQTATGLYSRLTSPLPTGQEGQCGFPDGGTDGGDGGAGANRALIVPGDITNSLLYLKILGTQPTGCGVRMPRVKLTLDDGGTTSVACDQADGGATGNCLSTEQANTIRDWIAQGAHETAPEN